MALENVEVITQFIDRATVWILALVRDKDGNLVDPTAIKLTLNDPAGEKKVDGASMTQHESTTGIYEYFYHKGETSDPMDEGEWRGEIDAIDGTGADAIISPAEFSFEVA